MGEIEQSIRVLEKKVFDYFTLSQLGKALLALQDLDQLSHVFLSSVHEATNAQTCALLAYIEEEKAYPLIKSIGLPEKEVKGLKFGREEGLFWQVLCAGDPFFIKDSTGAYRFESILKKWRLDRLNSHLWVPLVVKDNLVGLLTLGMKKDGASYTGDEMAFIQQLAAQAAVALDSALLNREKAKATRALGKKMESLTALYDVSKALNFANDLQKTLLLILDKSRAAANAQKASIMLLNKETEELEVKVVRGIDPIEEEKINRGEVECTKIKVGEGIAGKAAKLKKPVLVNEVKKEAAFKKSDRSRVDSIICMPLIANDECIGVMNITNKLSGEKFTQEDVEFLTTLAGQAAITIYNARLYHLAITDGLTQLHIHRYFEQRLNDEIYAARKTGRPVSLIMSDIDHFKKFNDTYGHQQGDVVLAVTAKLFKMNVREADIACRYGGEEFAVVLPYTDAAGAARVAEQLRKKVEEHDFPGPSADQNLKVTISLGVATFPDHAQDAAELVKAADQSLYRSKEGGRNRVTVS